MHNQLWRPRSPMVCCLQTEERRNPAMKFSPSPKAWEPGSQCCMSCLSTKTPESVALMSQGRSCMSLLNRESQFTLPLPFCSSQILSRLDGTIPQGGGWFSLSNLSIQMLISSRNTLINIPRNDVLPSTWASLVHWG